MRTLILDKYTHQSLLKQIIGNALTGLGWAFWVYLWLPLIAAITLLLGSHPEEATSVASYSILALLTTMVNHATVVLIMIGAFFAWSLLQWLGQNNRFEALQKHQANMLKRPTPMTYAALDFHRYQSAQSMVVSHDDTNGSINGVAIIKNKFNSSLGHIC
jgi:poly-beta-1,6-N-acetyl-D-glucosamine biosynthesis protein PgaD